MLVNSTINLLLMASTTSVSDKEIGSVPQMLNSSFVIDIVIQLHQNIKFKNFVFYVSKKLYTDTEDVSLILNELRYNFPTIPFMILIDNSKPIRSLVDTSSLCLVMTTRWNDPIMKLAPLSLNRAREFITIFLLFPTDISEEYEVLNENIRLLYEWVWEKRFLNAMLITINNNIYIYDPYPNGIVLNKTNDWRVETFLHTEKLNLKGWEIKTPIRFDIPRVFLMRRSPNNRRDSKLSGSSGKLYGVFIKYINGSLNESSIEEHEFEPFSTKNLLTMVESGPVEISAHSYTSITNISVATSYPVDINDLCLMVPFRHNYPGYMSLQKSFQKNSWFLLCFAAIYITVGIWLCTPSHERDLSLSFLQSICSLLLLSSQKILILPYTRLRFLFILLFVMGFCITNMFLSKMATYLTASSDENQINSIQDIIEANLSIMIDNENTIVSTINNSSGFLKLLKPVSKPVLTKHRASLNTSYGYSITSDRWTFVDKQQAFLKKPLFRLTSICVGPFYHVFPLQTNSDLLEPFKDFILAVQQSGLKTFWQNAAFSDALFMGYVQMFKIEHDFTPLSANFFRSIYYVWIFGLTLGALAFILEIKSATIAKMRKLWINKLNGN